MHQVASDAVSVKDQFPSLFQEVSGKLTGFKAHVDHGNAECMSRLPAPGLLEESPVPADVVLTLEHLDTPRSLLLLCLSGPLRIRCWPRLCDFWRKAGQTR